MDQNHIRALIYGHAVGDALGVPVEFYFRDKLKANPVKKMLGYGSYDVPAGAWSDDTSMTLCLLESMNRLGYIDYDDIMKNFVRWIDEAAFTPTGKTFDIGRTCLQAIMKYTKGTLPVNCGGKAEYDNGNGSLMRIAPLVIYLHDKYGENITSEGLQLINDISALTHGHARSQVACTIYVAVALKLAAGKSLSDAMKAGLSEVPDLYKEYPEHRAEWEHTYRRIQARDDFTNLPENEIKSSGYVVDTLEAVFWCLMNTNSYADCVLKAVNLGEDTDTVAAISGGLAGLVYGLKAIPEAWMAALQNKESIEMSLQVKTAEQQNNALRNQNRFW